jgi:lipopolysaccharide transport system permease protein
MRNIKVSYAQSVGGLARAVMQPAFQVLIFSVVFGGMLDLDTEGVPYQLFSTVGVVPWIYRSSAMTLGSGGLGANVGMLGKIYFPRLIFILGPVLGGLVSFVISLILVIAVLLFYRVGLTKQVLMLPAVFVLMVMAPLGVSLWLSSLTIRFRDFQIAMAYLMRAMIYLVPVMYASEQIPDSMRKWYIINPFVGVIEGYRSCLLGQPMHWDSLIWSALVSTILIVTGAIYFRRMERIIVDVI